MPRDPETGKFVAASGEVSPPVSSDPVSSDAPSKTSPENSDPGVSGGTANADPAQEAETLLENSASRDPEARLEAAPGSEQPAAPAAPAPASDPDAPYGRLKNGKPRKTPPKGMPRVSPPNARNIIGSNAVVPAQPVAASTSMPEHQIRVVAGMMNAGFFIVLQSIMGEEAAATKSERDALNDALSEYLKLKDAPLTPEMGLAVAYISIILTRAEKPTVREKIRMRGASIWARFKGWREARKQAKKYVKEGTENGSQSAGA